MGYQRVLQKLPPRFFSKFRGASGSLGQVCPRLPKGSVLKSSVERFTAVPPRLRKVCNLSGVSGAGPFWGAKRFCGSSPHSFFKLVSRFLSSFLAFLPNGVRSWSKMTRLSSWVLCSKWLPPPKRFLGVFPKQFFTLASQSPAVFWANGCCFRKGSVEGSANYSLHLSPK